MIKKFEKLYCLKSSLGNKGWIEDKDIIKPYLLEDRGLYKGYSSPGVNCPKTPKVNFLRYGK